MPATPAPALRAAPRVPPLLPAPAPSESLPSAPTRATPTPWPTRLAEPMLLGVIACAWVWTAPSWVLGGDTGEFATLVVDDGVAHPPGYPLYSLLLRLSAGLTRWLEPALVAGLVSAAAGIATLAVVLAAARALGASRIAALVATAVLGVAPLMWQLSTEPEVFSLNALLAVSLVACAAHGARLHGVTRLAALALLFGLGLANHHTIVCLAPVVLLGMVRALRELPRQAAPRAAALLLAAALFALGLTPYLTLLSADGAWRWGDLDTLGELAAHFARADYGTFTLSTRGERAPLDHLLLLLHSHVRDLFAVGTLIALLGAAALITGWPSRADGVALFSAWLLAGPAFVSLFDIAPRGVGVLLVERFHLLPIVLLAPLLACGLSVVGRVSRPWLRHHPRWVRRAAVVGLVAITALGAARTLPRVRAAQTPAVQSYVLNVLGSLPHQSVVVGTGDHLVFGMLYAQTALGVRPDVVYIDAALLPHAWYRRGIESRLDTALSLAATGSRLDEVALVEDLMATGRPVFVTAIRDGRMLEREFSVYPLGGVVGLAPAGLIIPPPDELARHNAELFESFALDYVYPSSPGTWASAVHEHYATTWWVLADALEQTGHEREAADALLRARRLAPWLFEGLPD